MKDIIVIGIILALIIGGSIYSYNYYKNTLDEFSKKLEALEINMENNDDKDEKVKTIEDIWQEKEKVLIIFQDHSSIDDIEEDLYECFHYYKTNQKDRFELSKEKMISSIEDLTKREMLTVVNIF